MGAAGELAVAQAKRLHDAGGCILCIEGAVPTAFGGHTCTAWTVGGQETTFQQAVLDHSSRAAQVIAFGTCAAYDGVSAAGPNPTGAQGGWFHHREERTQHPGCPPHPD